MHTDYEQIFRLFICKFHFKTLLFAKGQCYYIMVNLSQIKFYCYGCPGMHQKYYGIKNVEISHKADKSILED